MTEQIKELTTWDVGHHIKIMTNKVTYKGLNIYVHIYI